MSECIQFFKFGGTDRCTSNSDGDFISEVKPDSSGDSSVDIFSEDSSDDGIDS